MILIYLRGYLEEFEQKYTQHLSFKNADYKIDSAYFEMASPYFDIETETAVFQQKLGQYVEMERVLMLVGFEPLTQISHFRGKKQ